MDRKSISSLQGDDLPERDDDEDSDAWFRQEVEVVVADDDDGRAPFLADVEVDAHWSRQLAELSERAEQLRRAAESAP